MTDLQIKRPKPIEVPSKEEIYSTGIRFYKALRWNPLEMLGFYFHLYLFGQRKTEALATKIRDFKFRKEETNIGKILIVTLKSYNLKTKKVHLKIKYLPLIISKKHVIEGKMFQFLYTYFIKPRLDKGDLDAFLFPSLVRYKPGTINFYFEKYMPPIALDVVMPNGELVRNFYFQIHPHFLRHCRLSHLADEGLDVIDLMKFAGWTTSHPAEVYIKTDISRIINKMMGGDIMLKVNKDLRGD